MTNVIVTFVKPEACKDGSFMHLAKYSIGGFSCTGKFFSDKNYQVGEEVAVPLQALTAIN